jgi:primosomal protein N' (replication factor Y)
MNYYEVLVTQEYSARESVFTYAYPHILDKFQLVQVPLQKSFASGVIVKKTVKPSFVTKQIIRHFDYKMTPQQLQLVRFMTSYYGANEAQVLPLFVPAFLSAELAQAGAKPVQANQQLAATDQQLAADLPSSAPKNLPPLTPQQQDALLVLRTNPTDTVLLHGDTGTGKTRLYIERARDVLASGHSVLVLCPEIALVPQLQQVFTQALTVPVVTYHSSLTKKQKQTTWLQVTSGQPTVVIGTRSALFLPHNSLGLIIIDESHEPAYKQDEGVRFHATRVASTLKNAHGAQLILGSATPLVTDMYMARQRSKPVIRLTTPAITSDNQVSSLVIDMKDKAQFTTHPLLSNSLLTAIDQALQAGQQSIVYLNRRGTARIILCQSCGWQAMCPICDISLTYHHDAHRLRCHTCGYTTSSPTSCPTCNSDDIVFKSAGTKALESWLQKRFTGAKVARFDTDNLKAESFTARHAEVTSGQIDILVGTQLLVKGHDLPRLAVVGIVAADLSLQIPDFSAQERTYQLITQALGRVGRGHQSGTTIVQTFNPQNDVIQQALNKDYDAFYTTQIQQRQDYLFPPAIHIASLWTSKKSAQAALDAAQKVLSLIRKNAGDSILAGPTLTFHPKKRGAMTAQIVVKNNNRSALITLANSLPTGWQYDLEPINLL